MQSPPPPDAPVCKHEFVRIYQRKLKGLDRRLVATKAYLPVGFKMADFGHLSEGSYCFCSKCRARLFPKRTNADRAQARLAAQAKLAGVGAVADLDTDSEMGDLDGGELAHESSDKEISTSNLSIEEMEVVALELEDLESKPEIVAEADEDEL